MTDIYGDLFNYISKLEIIDSHEHLPFREDARDMDTDILKEYLRHYFDRDLVSAGLSPKLLAAVKDHKKTITERWSIVQPYFRKEALRSKQNRRKLH